MSKRERMLAIYAVLLGLASLSSILTYGISGTFWWVETTREDGERAFILSALHISTGIGGIVGAATLIVDWLGGDNER